MCFSDFSLHPSVPSALKSRGNERLNERNGAIDPPFILMRHRSQSITALLILLFNAEKERWSEGERVFGRSAKRFATQSMDF